MLVPLCTTFGNIAGVAREQRRIPDATVARLPVYLRILLTLVDQHEETISSERLAGLAGVNAAKVRKDLSYLGSYGTRGVGYDVNYLLFQIRQALGLEQELPIVVVGAGNLGRALANYGGFGERGFPVAAVLDDSDDKVGTKLGGLVVRHIDDLASIVERLRPVIGVIATPSASAQQVADRLVAAGVTAILNFAPGLVSVPETTVVREVDLALEIQVLSFYQRQMHGSAKP